MAAVAPASAPVTAPVPPSRLVLSTEKLGDDEESLEERLCPFAGKTAVVTGGSQGTGRAVAMSLAQRGYNVAICARKEENLKTALEAVRDSYRASEDADDNDNQVGYFTAYQTDLADEASVGDFVSDVLSTYEQIDLLINCAGVCCSGEFEAHSSDDWDAQIQVNLLGAVRSTKGLLPALKSSKGAIVNVNSFGGKIPLKGMTAYTATKFALDGFSQSLALELKDQDVFVGQVHPGVINSSFMERARFVGERGVKAKASLEQMLGGAGGGMTQTPEDVAGAVLASLDKRQREVVVGGVFKAAVAVYRYLGVNLFGLQP